MKKLLTLFTITFLSLFLFGCNEIEETDYTPNDGLIIKYTENDYEFDGLKKNMKNFYVIEIYSDRTVKYGDISSELKEKKISVSKYNKIIKLAFSEDFYQEFFGDVETEGVEPEDIDLTKDIGSRDDKEKGKDSAVYIFSTNGGAIAVGGQDANNDLYNELTKMIKKCGK